MLQHAPVGTPILYNVVGMYYSRTTTDTTLYQALHPSALPACNADQILASRWWWFLWLIVSAFKMVTSLCNADGLWAIFFFTWKSTNPRLPTCVIANGTQDSHCDTAEVVIKISLVIVIFWSMINSSEKWFDQIVQSRLFYILVPFEEHFLLFWPRQHKSAGRISIKRFFGGFSIFVRSPIVRSPIVDCLNEFKTFRNSFNCKHWKAFGLHGRSQFYRLWEKFQLWNHYGWWRKKEERVGWLNIIEEIS